MSDNLFDGLDSLHFDVLREISNIGTGKALQSLSIMLGKSIDMSVPKVSLVEFKNSAAALGNPEELVIGILVDLSGDVTGMIMFILRLRSAHILLNYMLGVEMPEDDHDLSSFDELGLSAVQEVGNIMCSSYINALASLIDKRIVTSVPNVAIDMAGAILSVPAIAFSQIADKILHIETLFHIEEGAISGYSLLIPDLESFRTIMTALGVF